MGDKNRFDWYWRTIAGKGASNTDLTGYTAGVLGLDEIFSLCTCTKPYGPYTYTFSLVLKV